MCAPCQAKTWEDGERKTLKNLTIPQLKEMVAQLGDSEMVKRCRSYRKDLLVDEIISLKRDVRCSKSITAFMPPAKRQKT